MSRKILNLLVNRSNILRAVLILILSSPFAVFSAIEFPENSLPDILQIISKANSQTRIVDRQAIDNALAAYNAENNLTTYFHDDRVTFHQGQNNHWEMRLQEYGYPNALKKVSWVTPQFIDQTVSYQHDRNLSQWFINSDLGMEHGIKLSAPPINLNRPESPQMLTFNFSVDGSVKFIQHGADIGLEDGAGNVLYWYHNLIAFDENNQILPVNIVAKNGVLSILVDASTATYPIYVDPLFTTEKRFGGSSEGDLFGSSVATSGDTVVIGVPGGSDAGVAGGVAYVHEKNSSGRNIWGRVKILEISTPIEGVNFGQSVALDDSIIVISAPNENLNAGAVYIFYRDQGGVQSWGQVKRIVSSDIAADDLFGSSVSLFGDTLVVGAPNAGGVGAVYVFDAFENGIDNWGQTKKITSPSPATSDRFGASISVDAETLVVGAPGENSNTGAAYVFYADLGGTESWGQAVRLTAEIETVNAEFGQAVSVYADNLVVGAPFNLDDSTGTQLGAAYIFSRDEGGDDEWGQTTALTGDATTLSDNFGFSVSIYQAHVAIGANKDDNNGQTHGAAYIFAQDQANMSSWPLFKKYRSSDVTNRDVFLGDGDASLYGVSVDISGNTFVVGGSENVPQGKGSAYIYTTSVDIGMTGSQTSATDINDFVTYDFTITNNDPEFAATGVVFNASLYRSFKLSAASSSKGGCIISNNSRNITCNIESIGANDPDVVVQVSGNVTSFGLYGIQTTIAADQSDAIISNNEMSIEETLKDTRGITNSVDKVGCSLYSSDSFDLTLLLLVLFSTLALAKRKADAKN